MKFNKPKIFSSLILILLCHSYTFAQCAMCKSSVESDLKTGGSIGTNLNYGILYLMTVPYIILLFGAYFFFRKQINAKLKMWKNKYFRSNQIG